MTDYENTIVMEDDELDDSPVGAEDEDADDDLDDELEDEDDDNLDEDDEEM